MHERTERAIARLLFVFCCAVPTAITLLIILITWTPWYHRKQLRDLASQLSNDTGLVVTIEDFQRVSPTKWTLRGIRLVEPETRSEVARVREITWMSEGDRIGVLLQQPELQSSQLQHAWHLIHDRFLCRPEKTAVPFQLAANDLTIHSATGPLTLRDVDALVRPLADAIEANIECLPASRSSGSPVKISVRRDRGGQTPSTQWTLETGDTPLPCSALAEYLPLMHALGPDAEFIGMLGWELDTRGRWSIDLGGSRFTQIELSQLCQDMPHRLTGIAELHLDRCFIEPGKTVNVSGSIRAREGWAGSSLLRSLHEHLDFDFGADSSVLQGQLGDVPYELVALHFRISDSEMHLDGICGSERGYEVLPPGVVLCTNRRAIAWTSDRGLPSLRLMRVVSPGHSELIPIASQTKNWMNLLIAPSRRAPPTEGLAPASRIRSVQRPSGGEPIRQR